MRNKAMTAAALAATFAALGLAGCGGSSGGGNNGNNQQASQVSLETATTRMNTLITRSTPPTASELRALSEQFQDAYNKNNDNRQAAFGYGMADLAATAQGLADLTGLSRGQKPSRAASVSGLAEATRLLTLWKLGAGASSLDAAAVTRAAGTPLALAQAAPSLTPQQVAAITLGLTTVKQSLDKNIPLIEKGDAAGFAYAVADPEGGTIRIDQADVKFAVGTLRGLRALVNLALAYEINPGGFDLSRTVGSVFGGVPVGGTVAPAAYLPAAPFGTLKSGGAAAFAAAKNDLTVGSDLLIGFTTLAGQRPSATGHLLDADDLEGTTLSALRAQVEQAKAALGGPVTVDGTTYNADAWFDSPPADIRAFLATYTKIEQGGETFLRATNLPDPTYGGLVTGADNGAFDVRVSGDDPLSSLILPVDSLFDLGR